MPCSVRKGRPISASAEMLMSNGILPIVRSAVPLMTQSWISGGSIMKHIFRIERILLKHSADMILTEARVSMKSVKWCCNISTLMTVGASHWVDILYIGSSGWVCVGEWVNVTFVTMKWVDILYLWRVFPIKHWQRFYSPGQSGVLLELGSFYRNWREQAGGLVTDWTKIELEIVVLKVKLLVTTPCRLKNKQFSSTCTLPGTSSATISCSL